MRLYAGPSVQFIELNRRNQMSALLENEFLKQLGRKPSTQEVMSWTNSLLRMTVVLENAKLLDHGIFLEYQLPSYGSRIDCIICGKDNDLIDNAVIVELKQWSKSELSDYDSERVLVYVAGGNREVLHPSVQVSGYKIYLEGNHTSFYEPPAPITLSACCFLHNYKYDLSDPLFDPRFKDYLSEYPVFTLDDDHELTAYLTNRVARGAGMPILSKIEKGRHRPSKKLMQHVSEVVKKKLKGELKVLGSPTDDYILLDDQIVAYDAVLSIVKKGLHNRMKYSLIIKGGPGTGKSVIALKLLADLNSEGFNAQYATGSNSFTETLRKIVGPASKGHFKYFMSYGDANANEVDVLIMDEAHRIREKTGYPFKSTGRLQIEDLINAAKVSVFFVDDLQVVRPNEIGTVEFIKSNSINQRCKVYEFELRAQFRCAGSDAFINWINHTLHVSLTANPEWIDDPNFEFKIFDSASRLEDAIKTKVEQGFTGRLTAGYCWNWSDKPNPDGSLVEDVIIGDFKRPWNAPNGISGLRKDIPKASFWAYEPNGISQIGCIYTAQGFEFDYVGVIFGKDLTYNFAKNEWEGFASHSHDSAIKGSRDKFLDLVKNTYRVLLTRGHKGCYVHFMDKDTENYFRSRVRQNLKAYDILDTGSISMAAEP
jgi:uncharacterized protein